MSRPMAMMRPRPRPPMMPMTDPGMEIARHRRPLLKFTVVLLLLGGGGWGWRSGYYGPGVFGGGIGLIVIIVIILLVMGRI